MYGTRTVDYCAELYLYCTLLYIGKVMKTRFHFAHALFPQLQYSTVPYYYIRKVQYFKTLLYPTFSCV